MASDKKVSATPQRVVYIPFFSVSVSDVYMTSAHRTAKHTNMFISSEAGVFSLIIK